MKSIAINVCVLPYVTSYREMVADAIALAGRMNNPVMVESPHMVITGHETVTEVLRKYGIVEEESENEQSV